MQIEFAFIQEKDKRDKKNKKCRLAFLFFFFPPVMLNWPESLSRKSGLLGVSMSFLASL